MQINLEYNIILPTIETRRMSCCIREQIIGIVMASERDFDNVTCVWSHFQTAQKNWAYVSFFHTQFENSNDVTPVQ